MTSAASTTARRRGASRSRRARARGRRRRLAALVLVLVMSGLAVSVVAGVGPFRDVVRQITLPLNHEDIIRQQAREKNLDPSLIAAMIYTESKFRDQTSHAGARGLMQITPATARFIAKDSGGYAFTQKDLATPQVNISYGAYYLRYLMRRYDGNERLVIAAYNAGETNVDSWVRRAGGPQAFDTDRDIPFPETRAYVRSVEDRKSDYRKRYSRELGL